MNKGIVRESAFVLATCTDGKSLCFEFPNSLFKILYA